MILPKNIGLWTVSRLCIVWMCFFLFKDKPLICRRRQSRSLWTGSLFGEKNSKERKGKVGWGGERPFRFSLSLVPRSTKGLFTGSQSRGRHLNHCYYIVIQNQLPIYSIILLISCILTSFFPAFVSFLDSASFPCWMMGSQEWTPSWQSKLLNFEMGTAIYLTRAVKRRF